MAENLTIESPDFDTIRGEAGRATENAVRTLWAAFNFEMSMRRQNDRINRERLAPKVLSVALAASQNDYNLQGAGILMLTGANAYNITGFMAPNPGDSCVLFVHTIGAGTITLVHNSGSSLAANRIRTQSAGNLAVATDRSVVLQYINSLWRELKLL